MRSIGSKPPTASSSPSGGLAARDLSESDLQRMATATHSAPSSPPQTPEGNYNGEWVQRSSLPQHNFSSASHGASTAAGYQNNYGAGQPSNSRQMSYTSELMNWNAESSFCPPSQPYASNSPVEQRVPAQNAFTPHFDAPPVGTSTDRLREYTQSNSAGFPMNVDLSGNDFDVHGIGGMAYLADSLANSRTGEEDATIEDAWRSILEDPRISTSGLTNQFYY